MSDDADEPTADDSLTLDRESIATDNSSTGRQPVPCPRCETLITLVVSYGPTTHRATPCGCRVPKGILEGRGSGLE